MALLRTRSVDRLKEVPHHKPADLPTNIRPILLRMAKVEARPHTRIVDFIDHLLEPLVVACFTGHKAVDGEAEATWAEEALERFGDGRRVTGMRRRILRMIRRR